MSRTPYYHKGEHKFLTPEAILEAHANVLAKTGGTPGLRDRKLLESAAYAPRESAGGQDAYPTFFSKVAALGYRLCQNHPFVDGNKRTALAAMLWTLGANGYRPKTEPQAGAVVMVLSANPLSCQHGSPSSDPADP
ncbi:type II toxin-antitoxin system death-on-curing family toxin [Thermus scotoductus]|uniref:type II toxin-antitoxin system death-on-curing family toxin n=1 Tax=Thermus scotoductus TaxID=37636 RepID=UPI0020A53330|nr:type II toxin-antitoxin system death-on-curing family toxin [Thermus scotoductus]